MEYLLLFIVPLLGTCKVLIQGRANKTEVSGVKDMLLYNGIVFFVIAVVTAIVYVRSLPSVTTVLLGLLSGVLNVVFQVSYMLSFRYGSVSVSGTVCNFSLVIPITFGFVFLNEEVTLLKAVGLLLIVVALLLITLRRGSGESVSAKWFLFVSVAFLSAGFANVIQAVFKTLPCAEERNLLLFVTYLIAGSICFVSALFVRGERAARFFGTLARYGILQGVVLAAYQILAMYSLTVAQISVSVYYPVTGVLSVIMLAVLGSLIFKEHFTQRQFIGIFIGAAAIFLLNLK